MMRASLLMLVALLTGCGDYYNDGQIRACGVACRGGDEHGPPTGHMASWTKADGCHCVPMTDGGAP